MVLLAGIRPQGFSVPTAAVGLCVVAPVRLASVVLLDLHVVPTPPTAQRVLTIEFILGPVAIQRTANMPRWLSFKVAAIFWSRSSMVDLPSPLLLIIQQVPEWRPTRTACTAG